jgi:hypothetical protein
MVTQDFIFSMLRHFLTLGAGYLVAHGIADAGTAETLVGGVMAAIAVAWSWYTHKKEPPVGG